MVQASKRAAGIAPSGIRKYFGLPPDVISLSVGEPDFVTPSSIVLAAISSLQDGKTGYTANSGLLVLRQAISDQIFRLYGVRYDPETEILVTVGGSEALHIAALALINPGDEVLVPEPSYVAYPGVVALADGTVVNVPTCQTAGFQLEACDMETHITSKTRGLLFGSPGNPTGAVISRERMLSIGRFVEKHDLFALSDEIYDRLVFDGQHTCFASLPGMRDRTITLGGFSKDYAMTGWRIGYACGPARLMDGLRKIHQYIIMSAPTVSQYAALDALTNPKVEDDVRIMVASYGSRRTYLVPTLNGMGLPTFSPDGAFYVFPDIRSTGLTSEEFADRLLVEQKVAVVPGSAFGRSGEGYVRMCYATSLDQIQVAMARLREFLGQFRNR